VKKLNAEINRILQLPDVKERLAVLSLEYTPNSPAEFAATFKEEVAKYAKMVKESGAKAD
jgi:tripartite-type tricarboxylate transporter receptor subunit TctC